MRALRVCGNWRLDSNRAKHNPAAGPSDERGPPHWRAERFCDDASCKSAVEHAAATQLTNDFTYIEKQISNRQWVAGDHLTAADFHLFVFGRLGLRLPTSTRNFPSLHRHTLAIASLPATKSAIAQQGITFEGPASGPG
jgi:glutathione S-transferase